ncbi:MAG: hypothetical protein OK452_08270 [Thaumarchaeota archaeon]|nr:hypothetical protein [Nitrososphaerota archaeon]
MTLVTNVGESCPGLAHSETSHDRAFQSSRRSRLDLCYELMNAIWETKEDRPTHLMQRVNLSWNVLTQMLAYLAARGLVKINFIGSRRMITLTELGVSCLQGLHEARSVLLRESEKETTESLEKPERIFLAPNPPLRARPHEKSVS